MSSKNGEKSADSVCADWLSDALLAWYDRHRRDLPWRAPAGVHADPYRVWLSEIMLQQTTVKAVAPYYARFLEKWPTVDALAAAPLDDVLSHWAGLGYYARARNLHACANVIAEELGSEFPNTEADLLKLPGIGQYTAAAIAAIAFDRKAAVVDGNVERVLARVFCVETPLPKAKPELRAIAQKLAPEHRPGDYAQAMMDLGATLCSPRNPSCSLCPLRDACGGFAAGLADVLPYREAKRAKPTRFGTAYAAFKGQEILLRKRPPKGLLGGMSEVPGSPWSEVEDADREVLEHAPFTAKWTRAPGLVRHTFTHFHLELTVLVAQLNGAPAKEASKGYWVSLDDLDNEALPSVMRKVVAHACDQVSSR